MKFKVLTAALLVSVASVPAFAQDITNQAGSNSDAVSGSQSGASSDNSNTNGQAQQANNAGIGNSQSGSASNSDANSASVSGSSSNGNQQGQSLTNGNSNSLGATNSQGVTVNQAWNYAAPLKTTRVYTNNAVPLAASSSFSSDYCGGTVSGGASAAPIGISIGGAAPKFDKSCQSLRRAEKFGMAAANWNNMGYTDRAVANMRLMEWSICTADSAGPKADKATAEACAKILNMGDGEQSQGTYMVPTAPQAPVTPLEASKPNVTPDTNSYDHPDKQYRGEATKKATSELGG